MQFYPKENSLHMFCCILSKVLGAAISKNASSNLLKTSAMEYSKGLSCWLILTLCFDKEVTSPETVYWTFWRWDCPQRIIPKETSAMDSYSGSKSNISKSTLVALSFRTLQKMLIWKFKVKILNFNKNDPSTIDVFCAPICNKSDPICNNSTSFCIDKNCSSL